MSITAVRQAPLSSDTQVVEPNQVLQAQLTELQRQHGRLNRALYEAEQVQRKLCAPRVLRYGSFEIASEIFPVRYLSGDFYDVVDLGGTPVLAVGDIAGKGLAASLWFTHLISLIRVHVSLPPPAAMAAINRNLCQVGPEPPMASLFLGWLDPKKGDLLYCNAGHPPTLVVRADGTVEALREGGPLLGALANACFEAGWVVLNPNDTLIGYSDGNHGVPELQRRRVRCATAIASRAPHPGWPSQRHALLHPGRCARFRW